jgi:UDP-glucuronate decarboxylase
MMNKIIQTDLESIAKSNLPWDRFANKSVLISGANGFLPAYMVETLLFLNSNAGLNIRVIGLVRNLDKANNRFSNYLNNKNLVLLQHDVCNELHIDEPIDFIVHAASQASPQYYGVDPVGTLSANLLGTINLLNVAREKNSESFLYFSSGEVYGQVDDNNIPVKEDFYGYLDPMKVRSCYAESKRMGENICVSYFHQYIVSTKVVRPFHTYGPGMQLDDGRVYADFVSDVVSGKDIEMKSDGSARRCFCYLKDATVAFFTVLLNGKAGEAYNVGNPGQEYSVMELAETVVKLSSKPLNVIKLQVKQGNQYLKSSLLRSTPNIDKISSLGWTPETEISEGFKRTINSYMLINE